MAKLIREEPLVERARQLRHTLMQGRDGRHFKVLTFRLYENEPPAEYPRFETNVQVCDENGKFRVLEQPLLKRFFREEHARKFHEDLVSDFDKILNLPEPPPPKKPVPAKNP